MLVSYDSTIDNVLEHIKTRSMEGCDSITISGVIPLRPNQKNHVIFQYRTKHVANKIIKLLREASKVICDDIFYEYYDKNYESIENINFILEVAYFDNQENLLASDSIEVVFMSAELEKYYENYLDLTQSEKINKDALFSSSRFLHSLNSGALKNYNIEGKKIFISGYGTGREIGVLLQLGASEIVGYDTETNATNIARLSFKANSNVKILDNLEGVSNNYFDLVISRHVIEHIPKDCQSLYLKDLSALINEKGKLFLNFPNGENPRDPHTGIYYFHQLSLDQRKRNYNHLIKTKPFDKNYLNMLGGILALEMPNLEDILSFGERIHLIAEEIYSYSDNYKINKCIPEYYEIIFQNNTIFKNHIN
jgi:2-polyprenyl-3-methyl-5-hydroxy-6-metoxy-1,4-benzoquinol methylase